MFSCTEASEGCLDVTASNFDVEADEDCCQVEEECCCTYPQLALSLNYKLRAADSISDPRTNFKLDQYFALDNKVDSISIDTFRFFINGIKPTENSIMESIEVLESFEYYELNTTGERQILSQEDNLALINCAQFRYTLGTYQSEISTIDKIDLTIGLPESLSFIGPDDIIDDHPLKNSYIDMFDEGSDMYHAIKINFTLKTGEDERVIEQKLSFESFLSSSLQMPILINKGGELLILMRINVLDVFKGIIFDTTNEDISLLINENLKNSVSIIE